MKIWEKVQAASPPASRSDGESQARRPGHGFCRRVAAAVLVVSVAGCATRPETPALIQFNQDAGYRYGNLIERQANAGNSQDLFVIVTISGGGMRAAALGYGVLEQLRDQRIVWNGEEKSLLDEVDVIAGSSTGGLVAAYYAAFGERIFEDFPERFLHRDVSLDFKLLVFNPVGLWKIASPLYGRSELAQEYYDDKLFHGATFGDLLERGPPYLVIGATDLGQGASFPFTQARFDAICADLSQMSLSRAVAASSAFPAMLSSVTLENRAGSCGYDEGRLFDETGAYRKARSRKDRRRREVIQSYRDSETRRYIRLQDGGLTDNLGLRTALAALEYGQGGWSFRERLESGAIHKLVVIMVDASVTGDICDETRPDDPGIGCDVWAGTGPPVNMFTRDTPYMLKRWLEEVGYPAEPPDTYVIYAGFQDLEKATRERFDRMPTDLYLPPGDIDALRQVAGDLVRGEPEFSQFVADVTEPVFAGSP